VAIVGLPGLSSPGSSQGCVLDVPRDTVEEITARVDLSSQDVERWGEILQEDLIACHCQAERTQSAVRTPQQGQRCVAEIDQRDGLVGIRQVVQRKG
jgi:hypothetical protein